MVKKKISKKLSEKIYEYLEILKADKLPIAKVILFGSYAKGTQHKWSDVDLCIISSKFNNPFKAMQYLLLKRNFDMKYTIEPVGFTPKDFKEKHSSSLINEIKRTGIEIKF